MNQSFDPAEEIDYVAERDRSFEDRQQRRTQTGISPDGLLMANPTLNNSKHQYFLY